MTIDILKSIIDFGLVILIWLVQLVIYPSFRYFPKDGLLIWHQQYTRKITFVVMPLMLLQVALLGLQFYQNFTPLLVLNACLVLAVWLLTFGFFVPLHTCISTGQFTTKDLYNLVVKNWWRTGLWTLVALLSSIHLFS